MEPVVIDVAALAAQLTVADSEAAPPEPDPAPPEPAQPQADSGGNALCQFSHPNPAGGRFCPECGLPAGVQLTDMNAVLQLPKPAEELTAEERAERDRQHQEALAVNAAFENAPPEDFTPSDGETVTIHFVDDGFTFGGNVWLRGQEMTIGPAHPRWQDAVRWILLSTDEQIARYGKPFFTHGPVPRQENANEQAYQVEMRRMMTRRRSSDVPETTLLGVRE